MSDWSDNTPDGKDFLTAGDLRHGGANGCQVRVRNSSAHPLVPLTPTVVDQSAGEPEESGAVAHGQKQNGRKALQQPFKRVPSSKGLPGGYLEVAEEPRRIEELWRQMSLPAPRRITRRRGPGHN